MMINHLFLVGVIKEMPVEGDNDYLVLEVKRNYKNRDGVYDKDFFKCHLWIAIERKILVMCKVGDLIAVKGRLVDSNDICNILCEQVILLNKTMLYS